MRSELAALIVAMSACSLDTDAIRERDAAVDALLDALERDVGGDAEPVDARVDAVLRDGAIDAADAADAAMDADATDACAAETCEGTDEDCDGRIDEAAVGCAGTCVDGECESSGALLWHHVVGSTIASGTARDRVFGLAATTTTVFAVGDAQGDQLAWARTVTLNGSDGFLAGMNAGGATSLATMTSGGGDAARDVVFDGTTLHVVGLVTGTATFGDTVDMLGGSNGFYATYTSDETPTSATRLGQTTNLEAVALTDGGVVAVGSVNGELNHADCGSAVNAAGAGIVWAPGRWCTLLGSAGDSVFPHAVAAHEGKIYVAGTLSETSMFGATRVDGGTGTGAFVARLDDASGDIEWVRGVLGAAGTGRAGANAIAISQGLVVVGGQADTDSDVLDGASSLATLDVVDEDPWLVTFAPDGSVAWTRVDPRTFSGGVLAVAGDRGDLFVAGWHAGASWGCSPGLSTVAGNGEDVFVVRLDADTRDCRWIAGFGSTGADRAHALAIDPVRDVVYVGGEVTDGAVIGGDTVSVSGTGPDGFVIAHAR